MSQISTEQADIAVASAVFAGLEEGMPGDWPAWLNHLPRREKPISGELAIRIETDAVSDLVGRFLDATVRSQDALLTTAPDLGAIASEASIQQASVALRELEPSDWWLDTETIRTHQRLYEFVLRLSAQHESARAEIGDAVGDALVGALGDGALGSPDALLAVGVVAGLLEQTPQSRVALAIVELIDASGVTPELLALQIQIAKSRGLTAAQATRRPYAITRENVVTVARLQTKEARAAIGDWMTLAPNTDNVYDLIAQNLRVFPVASARIVDAWAHSVGPSRRTQLGVLLAGRTEDTSRSLRALRRQGFDQKVVFQIILDRLKTSPTVTDRGRLIRMAKSVRPETNASRKLVHEAFTVLLDSGLRGDFDLAQRLVTLMTARDFESAQSLATLKNLGDESGWPISPRVLNLARNAGWLSPETPK